MAQIETWLNQEMTDAVKVRYLDGNLFSMDNAGNLIGVNLTKNGVAYSGGGTVSASVIRADGGTVAVTGALSGNVATVVLPQAAYAVPGVVSIVVKLTVSGEITTVAAVVANVYESTTSSTVDPGTLIPSIETLIAAINAAVASIPADYSSLWTSLAPAFSSSTAYTAGQYVTYNGVLYRFTTDHAAGDWNSSQVVAVNLGGEVTDLKSAFNSISLISNQETINGIIKEMYLPEEFIDISNITWIRVYNGQGSLYGFKAYNSSNTVIVDFTYSTKPEGIKTLSNGSMVLFGDVGIINALYTDYTVTLNDCVHDKTLMPTLYAQKIYNNLKNDEKAVSLPFDASKNDNFVNTIIKELYIPSTINTDTVAKVRIYNGQGGLYGFKLYTSNDSLVLDFTLSTKPTGIVKIQNNSMALFGDVNEISATYKDYSATVNPEVHTLQNMPALYAYQTDEKFNDYKNGKEPFTNASLCEFVRELFVIVSIDLSTVNRVRVYNGLAGLYGCNLYADSTLKLDCTVSANPTTPQKFNIAYAVYGDLSKLGATYKDFTTSVNDCVFNRYSMPVINAFIEDSSLDERIDQIEGQLENGSDSFAPAPTKGQIIYEADTKSSEDYIVNAVAYDDGVIIACRSDGTVVRIGYDGTEETLLTINGTGPFDWRGCFKDSNENVYVSPHASYGSMNVSDRGLYRLVKGGSSFTKVISLYDSSSSVPTETENNDDTIWTMCEDDDGNLYAGVYAHTVRPNPAIYKSTDGGSAWTYFYNFRTSGMASSGLHIHSIIWSKWKKGLYVIVGEVNTVFKSTDGGTNWTNLNVTLHDKGSSMLATPNGIFIGSDSAYNCEIDILYDDDSTHKTVFSGWANTVFAIRQSDVTGLIYAFTKIDSSVNSTNYFPPVGALTDASVIDTWHTSVGDTIYNKWKSYYDSVIDIYPDDAIRPQHYAILVSRDGGMNWDVLKAFDSISTKANGCWTTGYFANGECLTGRMVDENMAKPVVISEGRHKYVSGGCDLIGEIFVRTNTNSTVTPIKSN